MFNAAVLRKLVMFKQGSRLPPVTIFSAGTTKFYEQSHWRDQHIAPLIRAAISVAYEKHQMSSETKAWRNRATHLNCAAAMWTVYQLGSIIERSTSKQVRAQNCFTREPMLISRHCYSTAPRDPVRSVCICRRMNKDCCEMHSNSAHNTVINRSDGADVETRISNNYTMLLWQKVSNVITWIILGYVQLFERDIQALFSEFQVGLND